MSDPTVAQDRARRYHYTDPTFAYEGDEWRDLAACKGLGPDLFFVDKGQSARTADAKVVCDTCAVRIDCLEYAIRTSQQYGVWGGYAARELTKHRSKIRAEIGANPRGPLRREAS